MQNYPIIHVYAVCKNERDFIPFFIEYYSQFAVKLIIYDNQSTDGTREIIKASKKCELRDYDTKGVLRDDTHMLIKNSVWKESVGIADWVIVCDLDELVYHRNLLQYLKNAEKEGVTICRSIGYNMYSDQYPNEGIPILNQLCLGTYSNKFSKTVLFNPNKIVQLNSYPGGHRVKPIGEVIFNKKHVLLLHCKYLGGLNRLQKRWDVVGKELSDINVKNGWGINRSDQEEIVRRYSKVKEMAVEVFPKSRIKKWLIKLGVINFYPPIVENDLNY